MEEDREVKVLFLCQMRGGSHYLGRMLSGILPLSLEDKEIGEIHVLTSPERYCPLRTPGWLARHRPGVLTSGADDGSWEAFIDYTADGTVVSKTPYDRGLQWDAGQVAQLGSGWRVIRVMRDSRDQLASHRRLDEENGYLWDEQEFTGRCYLAALQAGRALEAATENCNYKIIRFEDLVSVPEATLQDIAAFTRLPIDVRGVLEAGAASAKFNNSSYHTSDTQSQFRGIDAVGRWRGLPLRERQILHSVAWRELAQLGYAPDDSWVYDWNGKGSFAHEYFADPDSLWQR